MSISGLMRYLRPKVLYGGSVQRQVLANCPNEIFGMSGDIDIQECSCGVAPLNYFLVSGNIACQPSSCRQRLVRTG